jgi:hypothetical protein
VSDDRRYIAFLLVTDGPRVPEALGDRRSQKPLLRRLARLKWQFDGHTMKGTSGSVS